MKEEAAQTFNHYIQYPQAPSLSPQGIKINALPLEMIPK
jgi:hypothetical protein